MFELKIKSKTLLIFAHDFNLDRKSDSRFFVKKDELIYIYVYESYTLIMIDLESLQ